MTKEELKTKIMTKDYSGDFNVYILNGGEFIPIKFNDRFKITIDHEEFAIPYAMFDEYLYYRFEDYGKTWKL